jgi:hypothetical protein
MGTGPQVIYLDQYRRFVLANSDKERLNSEHNEEEERKKNHILVANSV